MAQYVTNNLMAGTQQNMAATPGKTGAALYAATGAATLRRAKIYEINVGIDGPPNATDNSVDWAARRLTGIGTGTALVPVPLDPNDATTSAMTGVGNHTVEPTYTAASFLWALGANQRASYRWVVDPGSVGVLIIPAVNNNGIGVLGYSATYASTFVVNLFHQDM